MQSLATQRTNLQSDLSAAYARLVEHLTWLKLRETLDQELKLVFGLLTKSPRKFDFVIGTVEWFLAFLVNSHNAVQS
jgi:hypothetical protein